MTMAFDLVKETYCVVKSKVITTVAVQPGYKCYGLTHNRIV